MKVIIIILLTVIGGLMTYISLSHNQTTEVEIPPKENTLVHDSIIPIDRTDTIFVDSGKRTKILKIINVKNPVNKILLAQYDSAKKINDSLKMRLLFKEAITERKYNEIYNDSIQKITVESNVIGILKTQKVHYVTYPKTIIVKKNKEKISMFLGGFVYGIREPTLGISANILSRNKGVLYNFGFDNSKKIHIGVTWKIY